jgi:ribosomal protein S6--L-glutamate ligase
MVGGSPLIVKLLEGTQGKVLFLLKLKKRQKVLLMLQSVNANILVQEFIKEADGKDFDYL